MNAQGLGRGGKMNQLYAEAGVKKKETIATMALRALMILGILIGFFTLLFGGIISVIGLVLIVFLIFLIPRLNIEYEYVFVDGQLDFDKITGKSKRKTVLRIDLEQVEIVAPMNSHALDSYNNIQYENKDFSSGDKNVNPYVIIGTAKAKKVRITFEPTEKMLTMMKQKSPRKVVSF